MRKVASMISIFSIVCAAQTVATLPGSTVAPPGTSVQAMVTDSAGSLYVAGTTTMLDLPAYRAAFPVHSEAALMRTADSGATWSKLSSLAVSYVASIAADPKSPRVLFAGSDSLYKTSDGGETWRAVYPGIATAIAVDPGDSRYVVAGTSHGLISSSDGGETWRVVSGIGTYLGFTTLATDPRGSGLMVALGDTVWISRDHGVSWNLSPVPAAGIKTAVAIDPFESNSIYLSSSVGITQQLLVSTDAGQTWTEKTPPDPARINSIAGLIVDPGTGILYAAMGHGGLYQKAPGSDQWTQVDGPSNAQRTMAVLPSSCGAKGVLAIEITRSGGGLSAGAVTGFGFPFSPSELGIVNGLAVSTDCAVYAAKSLGADVFVAKIAPDRKRVLWCTYLGGTEEDDVSAIALDAAGNVYVAGKTYSTDFANPGKLTGGLNGAQVFVARFTPEGRLSYASTPGVAPASVVGLAVGAKGETYVAGTPVSGDHPDGFVLKLNAAGEESHLTWLGINRSTVVTAIAVDASGAALVTGTTSDGSLPVTPDASQPKLKGGANGFIRRLTPDGSGIAYASYLGGTEPSPNAYYGVTYGIFATVIDNAGNVWLAGTTAASDFPVTAGAYVAPVRSAAYGTDNSHGPEPPADIYIMKLTSNMHVIYSALLAGSGPSFLGTLAIDGESRPTVSLLTHGTFPLVGPMMASRTQAVVARLDPGGSSLDYSSYIEGSSAPPIAVHADGEIFAAVMRYSAAGAEAVVVVAGLPGPYRAQ